MEPPEPVSLILGLTSTVTAALLGAACGLAEQLVGRTGTVSDSSPPGRPRLERLARNWAKVRTRWSALQAASLGVAFFLVGRSVADEPSWVALAFIGAVTLLYAFVRRLLHGSMTPKASDHLAWLLAVLHPIEWLVAPFTDPINALGTWIVQRRGGGQTSAGAREAEVELVLNASERSGALGEQQSAMIRNVLEFGDTVAGDLMVPRPNVVAIDVNISQEELVRLIRKNEHSRYPVYRDRLDNIIGILHVKDVFLHTASQGMSKLNVRSLLRKAVFIPETQLAASVLQQLRAGRHHMAIVIDEFGGMSGVLTLEDLLEEIVGEIQDEYDDDESPIVELGNGHFVVDASIPIPELNRQVGIEIPDVGEYNSLGGFIVELVGRVPESGTELEELGHKFLIRSADERRISKVEIVPNPALRATG